MADYTKITDYAAKDALTTGDPAKLVKGTEIGAEFDAIATAIATKYDDSSLGTNVGAFLSTPSSANLRAALTDETGTGAAVFATSPTLVTPALGVATATSINALTLAANTNYNIAIGEGTALPSSSGADNIAIGRDAGDSMTTGSNCIAIGHNALTANDAAGGVIAIGTGAASTLSGAGAFGHICIGQNAGSGLTNFSEGNTIIGYTAGTTLAGGDNNTVIGWSAEPSAAGVSNEITLGNSSIATLRCQVTSITSLSDARDKTDVVPLPSGIDTIMALNPVRFTWNMRDGGKVGIKDAGFIAQELQAVDDEYLRLVYSENPEKLEASYGRLIPVLVKAIQDLQQQINELKVGK